MFGPLFNKLYNCDCGDQPVSGSIAPTVPVSPVASASPKSSILDGFLNKVRAFDPYPMLYARNSDGSVQTWKVEVKGNQYRFHTGRKGSPNIVVSEWTTCKGKNIGRANETSPEEQAQKEAKSALTLKLKSDGYWENESDIDKTRFFSPMLAHKYITLNKDGTIKERKKLDLSNGVYASKKLDGLRCVINREAAVSRLGNRFTSFPHILRELQQLFADFPDLVLDGECYTHQLKDNFDKLISLAKKSKATPEEIKEAEALEYWIFDAPTIPGGYHDRYQWLLQNVQNRFVGNRWIKVVEHKLIFTEADIDKELDDAVEEGFEGLMLNIYNASYERDKRTNNILKYKLFIDEEFEIIDIIEGDGNRSGMFGRAILKMRDGRTFKASAKGNEAFYIRLLKDKRNVIGKKATVRFKNYTPEGIPRHGTIIAIRDYE